MDMDLPVKGNEDIDSPQIPPFFLLAVSHMWSMLPGLEKRGRTAPVSLPMISHQISDSRIVPSLFTRVVRKLALVGTCVLTLSRELQYFSFILSFLATIVYNTSIQVCFAMEDSSDFNFVEEGKYIIMNAETQECLSAVPSASFGGPEVAATTYAARHFVRSTLKKT